MQSIAELEQRITAALDRIDRGAETLLSGIPPLPKAGEPSAMLPESDFAQLNEALDEERMLDAQLSERLRVVKTKDNAEIQRLNALTAAQDAELTALRDTVARLEADLGDLRSIAERGVTEPEYINHSLQTEVEALRAARAAEAAELAEIVAALTPLIEEAKPHA
jgi:predicted  nucleic acid-binding Zn-ribbon protein